MRAERLESESDKENGVEYGNRVGEGLQGLLRGENHIVDAGDEFDWRRRKFFQFLCAKILTDRPAICSGGGGAFGPPPPWGGRGCRRQILLSSGTYLRRAVDMTSSIDEYMDELGSGGNGASGQIVPFRH